jgi:hypothetical protein
MSDGNPDLDPGRNLARDLDMIDHDYLGDTADEF